MTATHIEITRPCGVSRLNGLRPGRILRVLARADLPGGYTIYLDNGRPYVVHDGECRVVRVIDEEPQRVPQRKRRAS